MHPRTPPAFSILPILAAALLCACQRDSGPQPDADATRLSGELEATRAKLADAEKRAEAKSNELALTLADAAEATKKYSAEKQQTAQQKDAQIRALTQELADLKKSEALVFAQASALQPKGLTALAVSRYQQFTQDYPASPLVADANRAIAELSLTAEKEARSHAALTDPRRAIRELVKSIGEGNATLEEIAPLLKNRSLADVIKLLGRPTRTYRDGSELGYAESVADPVTRAKETLVISFDSDKVSGIRAGYLGRVVKP